MDESLYLEQAEKLLFDKFFAEVNSGEYERADKIIDLMEHMSIV